MNAGLVIETLDKIYRGGGRNPVHAVKDLTMAVAEGEIVALLGSSGCGKTSTLRMIAGFESVSRGRILLGGRRIDRLAPARRNVAMAFEGYSLYPPLTVRDNIAFALKAARLPAAQIRRKLDRMAGLLEIGEILDKYPASISGGQQQRASLARALIRGAALHLLDEPLSQLEPRLRSLLRGRVKSHLIEQGMTAVFVTHDQTEANALADRIAVMEDGVLRQIASPAALKDRPSNLFVARFIGEPPMNVFPARIERAGGAARVVTADDAPGFAVPLSRDAANRLAAERGVHLGVRPHDVKLGEGESRATVISNQWLGDQTHVAVETAGQILVAVSHGRVAAPVGSAIPFAIDPRALHLFDRDSGDAIPRGGAPA